MLKPELEPNFCRSRSWSHAICG